jgi:hypothetical protein
MAARRRPRAREVRVEKEKGLAGGEAFLISYSYYQNTKLSE